MFGVMDMNRNNTTFFIELWRQNPCLWNIKHELYRNRNARRDAANSIANEMTQETNTVFTEKMVMAKIHTIRGQYRKEVGLNM